jgi:uracil phosphoribosyltransferase
MSRLWSAILALSLFTAEKIAAIESVTTPALQRLIYEIRDPKTEAEKFRDNLTKIGEYLAFEALSEIPTKQIQVETLTGATAVHELCSEEPVLITILRAGLPLCAGVQKVFPKSEVGFIAMSRNEETLKAKVEYIALPEIKDKTVIIVDTMIATAGSMLDAIKIVEERKPKKMIVIGAMASSFGISAILTHNENIIIFAGAIDPQLNEKGYIVPGLGDAGDRSFGKKAG